MKGLLLIIGLYGGLFGLSSCSDDENKAPLPSDITNIQATPAPGSIVISWELPEDGNLKYVEIKYEVPALNKAYRKQVSKFANQFVLDNILKKYGVIDFTLQAFNSGEVGGEIHAVSAQAEKALPTFGAAQKIDLTTAEKYTNAPFPTRKIEYLTDGNLTTFFHTQWQTTVSLPHYVVIDLREELDAFSFKSTNTNRAADSSWKTVEIYGSNSYDPTTHFNGVDFVDGTDITLGEEVIRLATCTNNSNDTGAAYSSEIITTETPIRWVWFKVTETMNDTPYFAIAEMEIYKYTVVELE